MPATLPRLWSRLVKVVVGATPFGPKRATRMVCGALRRRRVVSVHATKTDLSARDQGGNARRRRPARWSVTGPGAAAPGVQSKTSTRRPAPRPPLGSRIVLRGEDDAAGRRRPPGGRRRRTACPPPGAGGRAIACGRPEATGALGVGDLQRGPAASRPRRRARRARPPRTSSRSTSVASVVAGPKAIGAGRAPRDDEAGAVPARQHRAAVAGDVEALQARALRAGRELLACRRAPTTRRAGAGRPSAVMSSQATTGAPRSSWSIRTSPKGCRATAILCGALPPTRSSSVLVPWLTRSSRISGTRSGRASTPRRNDSEVVMRGDAPRGVRGRGGRAQRHQGGAERGESRLGHAAERSRRPEGDGSGATGCGSRPW